jgi:hypothetical protein
MAEGTCAAPGWTLLRVLALMGCTFALVFCSWFVWGKCPQPCTSKRHAKTHMLLYLYTRARPIPYHVHVACVLMWGRAWNK